VDQERFDAWTRRFAGQQSRRTALVRLGRAAAGAILAGVGLTRSGVGAQILPCAEDGCRCRTGDLASCTPGLVCCANDPNLPGGSGTCVPPSQCFGGLCHNDGVVCPATCAWGASCVDCCSGHCGHDGLCRPGGCRAAGCDCITGTLAPCDEGLACCPKIEGLLGGPGICLPRGLCN
jgi:hypothetical protein